MAVYQSGILGAEIWDFRVLRLQQDTICSNVFVPLAPKYEPIYIFGNVKSYLMDSAVHLVLHLSRSLRLSLSLSRSPPFAQKIFAVANCRLVGPTFFWSKK